VTSSTLLVASEAFGGKLDAMRTAQVIGRGLHAGKAELEADLCPIDELPKDLDVRMHRAHAVLIAAPCLNHETLLKRDGVFEVATRARQTGVPCYAITSSNELDLFETRILDLQVVLQASGERGLVAAGKKLAGLV
jgi:hypothetical protein